jgi:hypothetical protein
MNLQFIRNIQFTKLLRAGGRQREFNFRKLQPHDGMELFSVDVVNDRGDRIQFHMHKEQNEWKISEHELPPWVLESEPGLQQLLDQY